MSHVSGISIRGISIELTDREAEQLRGALIGYKRMAEAGHDGSGELIEGRKLFAEALGLEIEARLTLNRGQAVLARSSP